MKFENILKGTRARHTLEANFDGASVKLDIRELTVLEKRDVLAAARAFAHANGDAGDEDSPLYQYGVKLHTVALACVDHESPQDAPTPFFASVDEILSSEMLTREHVLYLFAHYEIWQDACSPRKGELSKTEFMNLISRSVGSDMGPFFQLAARNAVGLVSFYGRPVLELTPAQLIVYIRLVEQ